MGFNKSQMATIEPRGTIRCRKYIIDMFKELKFKIKTLDTNLDPWEISFHVH